MNVCLHLHMREYISDCVSLYVCLCICALVNWNDRYYKKKYWYLTRSAQCESQDHMEQLCKTHFWTHHLIFSHFTQMFMQAQLKLIDGSIGTSQGKWVVNKQHSNYNKLKLNTDKTAQGNASWYLSESNSGISSTSAISSSSDIPL